MEENKFKSVEKEIDGFKKEPHSKLFRELNNKLIEREKGEMNISGFEDIIGDKLGTGLFTNTIGTTTQLIFCLSISDNPEIKTILETDILKAEKIKLMREKKVLSGMKVLDLGCSNYPDFLLTISSLGATAVGVDVEHLSQKALQQGGFSYEQIDLRDTPKIEELVKKYGSFDIITEFIINPIPGQSFKLRKPTQSQIQEIAKVLLKPSGYLFSQEIGNIQGSSLQKIK